MEKVFLSDIDGTLIKTNTPVHPATTAAIRRFMAAGGRFALCTGRAGEAVAALARELETNLPCILLGGALLYDFSTGKVLWKQPMDSGWRDLVRTIYESEPQAGINVCTEAQVFSLRKDKRLLERGVAEDRDAPLRNLDEIKGEAFKILVTHEELSAFDRIKERLVDGSRFHFCAASRHFYEITDAGVSKGSAAKTLLKLCGLGGHALYAAGDGGTDLALRDAANLFFAPETAPAFVRERADFIFPPPAEGGLAAALEKALTL